MSQSENRTKGNTNIPENGVSFTISGNFRKTIGENPPMIYRTKILLFFYIAK